MKAWQRIAGNAVIQGVIVFFSTLGMKYPPGPENIYAAIIGGALTAAIGCQLIFKEPKEPAKSSGEKPNKPILGLIF